MTEVTDSILRQAKQEFLRRAPVVAIGLADASKISFLLERNSVTLEHAIHEWVKNHDLECEVVVAGPNLALATKGNNLG